MRGPSGAHQVAVALSYAGWYILQGLELASGYSPTAYYWYYWYYSGYSPTAY